MSFNETIATNAWFATQPRFGIHMSELLTLFGLPSVQLNGLPSHMVLKEATYYILQAWGLQRAISRSEQGIWFGMAALGTAMEIIGIAITHSHKHSRFMIHVQPFLPLKEMLWYPLTTYPCYVLASSFGLSRIPEALLTGLLQSFQVMQYEAMAYRQGVNYLTANPDFPLANVSGQIGKGPWINVYGNLAISIIASILAKEKNPFWKLSRIGFLVVMVIGFYPLNVMKFLGSLAAGQKLLPENIFSLHEWTEAYIRCVKESPVLEHMVIKVCLLICGGVAAEALRRRKPTDGKPLSTADKLFVLTNIVVYHALLGYVTLKKDVDPGVSRGEAFEIWTQFALAGILVHRQLLAMNNQEQKAKDE